jgi:EmrB/QacA subfamily drug resistance transporter
MSGSHGDGRMSNTETRTLDDVTMNPPKKEMGYEWVVLSVTTVGALLASIQESALLISLPDMMTALHMDFLTVMWVLLSYLLITTVMVPIFGRLSDMWGRKRLYVLGFALFTLGSLLGALAQPQFHGWDLVGYRIIQAMGGALLFANGSAMVADAFEARRLGFGLGVNMVAAGAGIVLGPVVGGILSPLGWQWIFLVNVPFGVFGTAWAIVRLKEPRTVPKSQSFDWAGSITFLIGLLGLLLAVSLVAFPLVGSDTVDALFVIGAVGLIAFFLIERRAKHPMMDLQLFRNREYAVGNFTNLLNGLCRGAALFLLIFFLQGPYGEDPLTAGLSLIPFGVSFIIVGPLSGRASDRYGPRNLTILGLALTAIALLGLALIDHSTPFWVLALLMVLMGVGGGLYSSPNSSSIMNAVPPERRGTAAGTRMMLMNTGQMFSLALAFPLVLSGISQIDMMRLFLYGGGISAEAMALFESGLHSAFLLFFIIALVAVVVGTFRPRRQRVREVKPR